MISKAKATRCIIFEFTEYHSTRFERSFRPSSKRPSETCRVIFNKLENCASSWFYYRNISRCTVPWMSKVRWSGWPAGATRCENRNKAYNMSYLWYWYHHHPHCSQPPVSAAPGWWCSCCSQDCYVSSAHCSTANWFHRLPYWLESGTSTLGCQSGVDLPTKPVTYSYEFWVYECKINGTVWLYTIQTWQTNLMEQRS